MPFERGAFLPGKVISSSTNVCGKEGYLAGIFCASSSSGTATIYDDPATGTSNPIVSTLTLVAGTFYPIPLHFYQGCYVVIANTASITVMVQGVRS